MSYLYKFQSVNTKFFVISRPEDKAGQEVDTKNGKDSIPEDSMLFVSGPIGDESISIVEILGAHPNRLYISLKGDANKTKLTWSEEKYSWIVRKTGSGSYVITPASGADLFWFDEFNVGIGDHVEVRNGQDIQPPQNEWEISPAM